MAKYDEYYDEKKQSSPPMTITMTNEQLQMLVAGIVNGLRATNQNQGGPPATPGSQQVNNPTPTDRQARPGSVSIRPAKQKNTKYIDYSKISSDTQTVQPQSTIQQQSTVQQQSFNK